MCNIIVWGKPFNPNGDITAYEAQFYIPDTQLRVLREIAQDRTFYIIDEEDKLGGNMHTFVQVKFNVCVVTSHYKKELIQVRARTQSGPGQWSVGRSLGNMDSQCNL